MWQEEQEEQKRRQEYFKQALSDFTFEAASNGAVRHLADRGYTAGQIVKMLDFPTPAWRVQKTVWEHFLEKGILLLEEPGKEIQKEKYEYVTDYDAYGRKSLRRVTVQESASGPVCFTEYRFCRDGKESLFEFLEKKCRENGEEFSYISCDYGLRRKRDPKEFEEFLESLKPWQKEYIEDLFQERRMVYHRLDKRMRRIGAFVHGAGYPGTCYFIKSREKVLL